MKIHLISFFSVVALIAGCATETSHNLSLTVLHTNDTHSHFAGNKNNMACLKEDGCMGGMGLIAKIVREEKAQNPNTLFLDAGDKFQGSLLYSFNKVPMVSAVDKEMGYDAATLGNHEYDEGCQELAKFIENSPFPMLAANLAPGPNCPLSKAKVEPYIIRNIQGTQVGIIGLSNPDVVEESSACKDTHFNDPVESTKNAVQALEAKGIKVIIAVTHLGLPFDEKLASSVNGLDLIVGGHSHDYIGPGSPLGPYPIVKHSPDGQPVLIVTTPGSTTHLGKLNIAFDSEGHPLNWQGEPMKLDAARGTPAITKIIEKGNEKISKAAHTILGENQIDFIDGMEECRHGQCLSGSVITDAMLKEASKYGADFAIINSGSIRSALPKGAVTAGDLMALQPFEDILDVRKYSGRQIQQALEHGVSDVDGIGPRLLQVANLRYSYDPNKPIGKRIINIEVRTKKGYQPIHLTKDYIVALNTFLSSGGDGYKMIQNGTKVVTPRIMTSELVARELQKQKVLKKAPEIRIIKKTES